MRNEWTFFFIISWNKNKTKKCQYMGWREGKRGGLKNGISLNIVKELSTEDIVFLFFCYCLDNPSILLKMPSHFEKARILPSTHSSRRDIRRYKRGNFLLRYAM